MLHQPAPDHAPGLTSGPIPDKPFPCWYHPDNGIPLPDGLLLEVRENDPLVKAMHCHGRGEPGKFALPVLPREFKADLDRAGDLPPLFRNKIALFGIFEKKDRLVPATISMRTTFSRSLPLSSENRNATALRRPVSIQ